VSDHQPVVFIGSSSESWKYAEQISRRIERVAAIRQWKHVFEPGEYVIDRLRSEVRNVDFALFVLAPDDVIRSRGRQALGPRDNIVFEAGMFMSSLGRERCFLIENSDARLKLPSDILGLTTLRYNGIEAKNGRHNWAALHKQVSDPLIERITNLGPTAASELPEALARIFMISTRVETRLPLSVMTSKHANEMSIYLESLFNDGHHDRHALTGTRLRRVFEDGGHYSLGVSTNKRVARSHQILRQFSEARWTQLKGVAYLQILMGAHAAARTLLAQLLSDTEPEADENRLLRAYAHRYTAISHHRDSLNTSYPRANDALEHALDEAAHIQGSQPTEYERFRAKVLRNKANLIIDSKKDYSTAITLLEESQQVFTRISDYEHLGITALAIAKAEISLSRSVGSSPRTERLGRLIAQAERSATSLGWPEGLGNAHECRADFYLLRAECARKPSVARHYLAQASDSARVALAEFQRTDASHRILGIAHLTDRIGALRDRI
jgi:hypothetical protein